MFYQWIWMKRDNAIISFVGCHMIYSYFAAHNISSVVTAAHNTSEAKVIENANALKTLFEKHFITASEGRLDRDNHFARFRDEYLDIILSWTKPKLTARINAVFGDDGAELESKHKSECLMKLPKVVEEMKKVLFNREHMQAIRKDQNRYVVTENKVRDITGGQTTLLRGDVALIESSFHASTSVAHTAAGWLDYIKNAIVAFRRSEENALSLASELSPAFFP
jgi:hypothetical protein